MKRQSSWLKTVTAVAVTGTIIATMVGCQHWRNFYQRPTAVPLGTISDQIWKTQEQNAEMSDFVVHLHEFQKDSEILNTDGEEHLKQIAARLHRGQDAFVIVERTRQSPRADTDYRYPVHTNPKLDMRRREMIVRLLGAMGVSDADQRVIVAPRLTPGYSGVESEGSLRTGKSGGSGVRGGLVGSSSAGAASNAAFGKTAHT